MPDTPFRTPDEWRRAREAYLACCDHPMMREVMRPDDYSMIMNGHEVRWNTLYPCPPEPDRDEDIFERVNADQVRREDARSNAEDERVLDAYVRQYGRLERSHDTPELRAEIAAARAAVLARMQPQGEVYEVEACDAHGVTADAIVCFRRDEFTPGQRVRVVRVAE